MASPPPTFRRLATGGRFPAGCPPDPSQLKQPLHPSGIRRRHTAPADNTWQPGSQFSCGGLSLRQGVGRR